MLPGYNLFDPVLEKAEYRDTHQQNQNAVPSDFSLMQKANTESLTSTKLFASWGLTSVWIQAALLKLTLR